MTNSILNKIRKIPEGYSQGTFTNRKYGITKTTFNAGNSFKIYGEELGGTNFISLNFYITTEKEVLKPCEMPEQKVLHFLENVIVERVVNK